MLWAYYNDIDDEARAALAELMRRGIIMPGAIDGRSIKDVHPDEIKEFTQVHLCAGIGVWSYVARLAGWPDERKLWTASFPCQPISNAGKRKGADDPRHLWPYGHKLIGARRPPVVLGEQVAGALGYNWFDGVQSDLAPEGYACRAVDIPACSVDAPHIRNRLAWVAVRQAVDDTASARCGTGSRRQMAAIRDASRGEQSERRDGDGGVGQADAKRGECDGRTIEQERGPEGRSVAEWFDAPSGGVPQGDATRDGRREGWPEYEIQRGRDAAASSNARELGVAQGDAEGIERRAGLCEGGQISDWTVLADRNGRNGTFWSGAEWLVCHDQKARRAKPGIRLLVDGSPVRIPRWRFAGNAICAPLFVEVIKAFLETEEA